MAIATRTTARAGLALAAVMALAACGGEKKDEKTPAPSRQTVTAATVTLVNLPRVVTASGTVSAWEEVPVAAETGGLQAVGVYVDEGAVVRQGQILVKLNDSLLSAQLRQQDAAVAAAEANAAREDAELARAHELKGRGFLSQASLDMAVAEQRSAEAQLASARAARTETATRLDQTNLRAPVAGRIISRSVTRGQIVQAGTELFRMVREGRLELDAQTPETELALIRPGQTAVITSDQAGTSTGRVRIVTPEVDPQTRLGVARISLGSGDGLRSGMFARADIDVGDQPMLTVPSASIVFREGRSGVYVIGQNGAVRFTPVATGARSGDVVAVREGLQAGQQVVVQGAGFLGEGDLVAIGRPVTAAARPAAAPTK